MSDRDGWAMWEGPEVEGRLSGVWTLLLYCIPEEGLGMARRVLKGTEATHIFFCENWINTQGQLMVAEALTAGHLVTLEGPPRTLKKVNRALRERCHLLVSFDASDLRGLGMKPTDSVRLLVEPFRQLSAVAGSFVFNSNPSIYPKVDHPVAWSRDGARR